MSWRVPPRIPMCTATLIPLNLGLIQYLVWQNNLFFGAKCTFSLLCDSTEPCLEKQQFYSQMKRWGLIHHNSDPVHWNEMTMHKFAASHRFFQIHWKHHKTNMNTSLSLSTWVYKFTLSHLLLKVKIFGCKQHQKLKPWLKLSAYSKVQWHKSHMAKHSGFKKSLTECNLEWVGEASGGQDQLREDVNGFELSAAETKPHRWSPLTRR